MNAQDRYAIYFSDKEGSVYSLERPEEFLSDRALQRRTRQGIVLESSDLPVSATYIDALKGSGISVFYTSKWLNAALIQGTLQDSALAASQPFVLGVERLANGERRSAGGKGDFSNSSNSSGDNPQQNPAYAWHGIDRMHMNRNFGENMRIAIMDGSFYQADQLAAFQHLYESGKIIMTEDIVRGVNDVYEGPFDHGTRVFSVLGGKIDGQFTGIAPESEYLLFRTEDEPTEYRIEEFNWTVAAEKADSAGADVINTSLGYSYGFSDASMNYTYTDMDGETAMISRAAVKAVATGMMVVVSAGNEGNSGWSYITAPADADGVLAAGAVLPDQQRVSFSSFGPTADGRVKPDAASLGVAVPVVRASGDVALSNGTSFSSPILAGLSALLWNANPELTNRELLNLIRDSGHLAAAPDNELGYGIPFIDVVLSAGEELLSEAFIYPNPVQTRLHWNAGGFVQAVEIYDMQGKVLMKEQASDLKAVDVTELSPGIYMIRLNMQGMTRHLSI